MHDRNDISEGGLAVAAGLGGACWGRWEPGFGGPTAAVGDGRALEAAGFLEDGEGSFDLAGFLVAAEEVADVCAGDARGSGLGERPDFVGGGGADAVAEDPAGRSGGLVPDGESRFEVGESDVVVAVQGGLDGREADGVRFGTAGRGAEEAFVAA